MSMSVSFDVIKAPGPEGFLPQEHSQSDNAAPTSSPFPASLQPREELQHVLEFINTEADGHRIATDIFLDAVDVSRRKKPVSSAYILTCD